ncbi:MAG: isoprenylcysteine carboxylmethyltransferase family protein [Clostridia bacterium]|nr:isoprenylcysteine carboxylmethyltransferase family protein [Clostridia bacterium]
MKLIFNALMKFIAGLILVGLLLFVPAGTMNYKCGWLFILLLFVPMLLLGVVMLIKSPKLLEKRLDGKEKEKTQRCVVAFSALIFLVGFIVSGLDFRFGWSKVPSAVVIIASVLFLLSYAIYAEVMRENAYLSRTIEVQEGQKVIDTGLYGIVRHPMYMATILLFLMIPLILGSWYGFIVFFVYPLIIVVRINNEEKLLAEQLDGYVGYRKKVKYRIIPFIW